MKKFFLTLSFLNILWAHFTDPAQFAGDYLFKGLKEGIK